MRINVRAMAFATGMAAVALYLLGAIAHFFISPWGAPALVSYLFRIDIAAFAMPFALDSFIVGIAVFAVVGAGFGSLTAWVYNRFARTGTPASPRSEVR
jgi:hypothetical protein